MTPAGTRTGPGYQVALLFTAVLALLYVMPAAAVQPELFDRLQAVSKLPPALLFFLIAAATMLSEDLTCITCGLLVSQGTLDFPFAVGACLVGIMTGDMLLFAAGRYFALPVLHRPPLSLILKEEDIHCRRQWFDRYGSWAIFTCRFVPGSRLPTFVAAGMFFPSVVRPFLVFFAASVVWVPLLVGLAMQIGSKVFTFFEAYQRRALPLFLLTACAVYLFIHLIIPLFTFKGRRLLLSSWRRKTRWEFWPRWIVMPPLVLYVLCLGVRHRCLTLFTSVNPCMFAGGFVGESKIDLLQRLAKAGVPTPPFIPLPADLTADQRAADVSTFMDTYHLTYPVVLKPDLGERGRDVAVLHAPAEVRQYLSLHPGIDLIAQAYVSGLEYGVFYIRHPDQNRGYIFSITDKRFPFVTGNGSSNLEQLILRDDRTVCMAPAFLSGFRNRLYEVPQDGVRIDMVEIGTHCRGALFLDGAHLLTPALEAAVEKISRGVKGFYFGRYDLRVPDEDALRRGERLTVLEVNGVTSEATHIYQPGTSLFSAYRTLFRQWRLAFEIGEANRKRGVEPLSPRDFFRMLGGKGPHTVKGNLS